MPPNDTPASSEISTTAAPRWLEALVRLLDDRFRIPGTELRFGIDALLGLIPGVGDATSAVSSISVFWLAVKRGVPRIVIARMALNLALDALLGAVPFLGDAFDFVWKANRKNLTLVQRYQDANAVRSPRPSDYFVLGLVGLLLLSALLLPLVVASAFLGYFWSHSASPGG